MESRACFVPWGKEHSECRKNTGRGWPEAVENKIQQKCWIICGKRSKTELAHIIMVLAGLLAASSTFKVYEPQITYIS